MVFQRFQMVLRFYHRTIRKQRLTKNCFCFVFAEPSWKFFWRSSCLLDSHFVIPLEKFKERRKIGKFWRKKKRFVFVFVCLVFIIGMSEEENISILNSKISAFQIPDFDVCRCCCCWRKTVKKRWNDANRRNNNISNNNNINQGLIKRHIQFLPLQSTIWIQLQIIF